MTPAVETRHLVKKAGFEVPLLSGGSTGTYNIDSALEGVTELQPGSYVFMDVDYRRIGGQSGEVYSDFAPSLTVVTTVISRPSPDVAIVDAGLKAFSTDRSFGPECVSLRGSNTPGEETSTGASTSARPSAKFAWATGWSFSSPTATPASISTTSSMRSARNGSRRFGQLPPRLPSVGVFLEPIP